MQEVSRAMLIKGQAEFCCIFDLSRVVLRVKAGNGGAWLDANGHTVARYANRERALDVMSEIWARATMLDKSDYALPED